MAFGSVEFPVAPARNPAARRGTTDPDATCVHKAVQIDKRTDRLYRLSSAAAAASLATGSTGNRSAKHLLADSAWQLNHQAQLLRLLQIPTRATMDAAEYLSDLCFALSCAILDRLNLHLVLVADPLPMGAVSCSRLGMIVVQLVIDAARHAFRQKRGVIRIDVYRTGGVAECRVTDNGSADQPCSETNGLRFVRALAATLRGSLESTIVHGASSIAVRFPYRRNRGSKTTAAAKHRLRQRSTRDDAGSTLLIATT